MISSVQAFGSGNRPSSTEARFNSDSILAADLSRRPTAYHVVSSEQPTSECYVVRRTTDDCVDTYRSLKSDAHARSNHAKVIVGVRRFFPIQHLANLRHHFRTRQSRLINLHRKLMGNIFK